MTHVLSIDFEAGGGVPSVNGFTEFAAVLMRVEDRAVISSFHSYACMEDYVWDEDCLERFWLRPEMKERYAQTLKGVSEAPHSPHVVIAQFIRWVDGFTQGPEGIRDVYMISNSVAYDVGILRHFAKRDMLYLFDKRGPPRDIVDVCNVYVGMSGLVVTTEVLDKNSRSMALLALNICRIAKGLDELEMPVFDVKADHHPLHDALDVALFWCFVQEQLKVLRETKD